MAAREIAGEATDLEAAAEARRLPEAARLAARREVARLSAPGLTPPDRAAARAYVEALLALPWEGGPAPAVDPERVRDALERRVFGLDEAKRRILERAALLKLGGGRSRSPTLLLLGPPGTGKTALAAALAQGLGRPLVRVPVGGALGPDILGRPRASGGAGPGALAAGLARAGAAAPVFLVAGVDRVAADGALALLEVLDPARRSAFVDRYLGVPIDLSRALFLATAHHPADLPPVLERHLETVTLLGYTAADKVEIARRRLLAEVFEELGPEAAGRVTVATDALERLARAYSPEAGVSRLRHALGEACRRALARVALAEADEERIGADDLARLLGEPARPPEPPRPEVGVATGLAWTRGGGDLLLVEAVEVDGRGEVAASDGAGGGGSPGGLYAAVVETAYGFVRSQAEALRIDPERLRTRDVRVRISGADPAAVPPGDEAGAGLAVLLALVSLLTDRPVRPDIAVVGGVTLRGAVAPVAGVAERVLAAERAGRRKILVPAASAREAERLGPAVRRALEVVPVERAADAFREGLIDIIVARGGLEDAILGRPAPSGSTTRGG